MSVTPFYQKGDWTIYCDDTLQVLYNAPDLLMTRIVVSDPPYVKFGSAQDYVVNKKPYDPEDDAEWLKTCLVWHGSWLTPVFQLVEANVGQCWLLTSDHYLPTFCRIGRILRWRMPGFWRLPDRDHTLLLYGQGLRPENVQRAGEVWRDTQHEGHTNVSVVSELLKLSSKGPVLDPFCGTGSTLVAAKQLGWPAVGIESSQARCEEAAARLDAL